MNEPTGKLDDLRREIDDIDTALHDLIMRRTAIVAQVAAAKGPQVASGMRPGREAEILRRLAARHDGAFPRGALLRMWREMLGAMTDMQGPYDVAVFGGEGDGFWDASRDFFGSYARLSTRKTRREVLVGVADGSVTHGVLPYPGHEDERPWWAGLWSADAPQVVLRLPFFEPGNARGDVRALVIARLAPEATGEDRSLVLLDSSAELQATALDERLAEAGMTGELVCAAGDGSHQYLVEVDGFVENGDRRLAALESGEVAAHSRVIGAYPVPLAGQSDGEGSG